MMITRRKILSNGLIGGLGAGAATLLSTGMLHAQVRPEILGDKNLLFVLQRGAADGLATLAPFGDPGFATQRGAMARDAEGGTKLNSMFALHPALEKIAGLYASHEALFVHAVASSYRDRSHFDGQNLIESGGASAYTARDGWINRLIGLIAAQHGGEDPRALALAPSVPLALQGANSVGSYAPNALPDASDDLMARISELYGTDPLLGGLWQEALRTRELANAGGASSELRNLRDAQAAGTLAASLMSGADSARIMMIETNGWDSHAGQRAQLNAALGRLDAMLGAYHIGMGADWANTLVIVATEFGRTVKPNGTGGTDHGTASAAMLLGGSVAGGRVIADWPGLSDSALYEGRDLMPTTSLESLITGAVAGHFGLDPIRALAALFPQRDSRPLEGLLRG